MSVTFSIEQERTGWIHACCCGKNVSAEPFESYVDAYATLSLVTPCEDPYCAMYAPFVQGVATAADELEINLANANARDLLESLGYVDGDLCGSATGEDLYARVLVAQAFNGHDEGREQFEVGNMVYCARPEGYFDERYAQITALAQWAEIHEAKVVWA